MRPYKAILWFSLLIVIGEGLTLAEFDFAPISGEALEGKVLGKQTSLFLEQTMRRNYPATYMAPEKQEVQDEPLVFQGPANKPKEEDVKPPPPPAPVEKNKEKKQSVVNREKPSDTEDSQAEQQDMENIERIIELLNTPADREAPPRYKEKKTTYPPQDPVQSLINKNKRVYLKSLQKQLKQISDDLDLSTDL